MHHHGAKIDPMCGLSSFGMAEHSGQVRPTAHLYAETVQRKRERKQPELQAVVIKATQAGARANFVSGDREPRQQVGVAVHSDNVRRRMMQDHMLVRSEEHTSELQSPKDL